MFFLLNHGSKWSPKPQKHWAISATRSCPGGAVPVSPRECQSLWSMRPQNSPVLWIQSILVFEHISHNFLVYFLFHIPSALCSAKSSLYSFVFQLFLLKSSVVDYSLVTALIFFLWKMQHCGVLSEQNEDWGHLEFILGSTKS